MIADLPKQEDVLADYITLAKASETKLEAKKSVFIGRAIPVTTVEEVEAHIQACRQEFPDARHIVYAWRIGSDGRTFLQRYTDDGEPKGTAGLPVLDVLAKPDITDALILVVRYFGGILLGTGGLVRAYGTCASEAVQEAGLVRMTQLVRYELTLPYSVYDSFLHWCGLNEVTILESDFLAEIGMKVAMAKEKVPDFLQSVADLTGGIVQPGYLDMQYTAVPYVREETDEENGT